MKPISRPQFLPNMAGILFCLAMLLGLAVQFVLTAFLHDYALSLVYSFVAPLVYIVVVFVGGRLAGVDVPAAVGLRRAPRRDALWAVALAVCCVLAFLPIAMAVQWLFGRMGYHATPNYADYTSSWGRMLLGLVGLAIMPALGEETLLRGCVFGGLRCRGTYFAIFLSAALFALMHANPVQLVHQFLIGAIMAYLVFMSGTVWTSVIFHFCNNAIVILYEFTYVQSGATFDIPWWAYLILFVVFTPVVAVLLAAYGRAKKRAAPAEEGALVFADQMGKQPLGNRVRSVLDCHGEFLPYNTQYPMGVMWGAFILTGVVWVINTIAGWVGL